MSEVRAYYNENDPSAAAWLRELIKRGLIADGDVDERSIEDVRPVDLGGYTQCHFFAGIGGWAYAMDIAGWPRDRPVWTGSCPCQPFSAAGKGNGFEDERHLWPAWQHLIAQCRPPVVFGEQVASKAAIAWIELVHADLEGLGYAFGCVPFPAAGVGAPHIRDRSYWLANADSQRYDWLDALLRTQAGGRNSSTVLEIAGGGEACGLGNSERYGLRVGWRPHANQPDEPGDGAIRGLVNTASEQKGISGRPWLAGVADPWSCADLVPCLDGKTRPVEPGTSPLAHGIPARVVRLRGYGNAIVPQQAAEFVRAYVEAREVEIREAT